MGRNVERGRIVRAMHVCSAIASARAVVIALAAIAAGQGCLPQVESTTVNDLYPTPGRASSTFPRQRDGAVAMEARAVESSSGGGVRVRVRREVECERVTRTEMTNEAGTRRSLRGGTLAQATNLTAMALLVAAGIATYAAAPCDDRGQCSAAAQDKADARRGAGIVVAISGALPAGLFVWNIARAADDVETRSGPPRDAVTSLACPSVPARDVPVTVQLGATELVARTGADGVVDVPISWNSLDGTFPSTAAVKVTMNDGATSSVSVELNGLAAYQEWVRKKAQAEKNEVATREAEDAVKRREHAIRCLEIAENAIRRIATGGKIWTREKMDSYREAVERLEVVQRSLYELSALDVARSQRVRDQIATLARSYEAAVAEQRAQIDANVVQMARGYILGRARSPSTLRFLSDTIMLRCPGGYMVMHEFDAQNGFGALVRSRWAVSIDTRTNRIDADECSTGRVSVLCAAPAIGGCSALGME